MEKVAKGIPSTFHPRGKWSTAQLQLILGDLVWILVESHILGGVRVCTVKTAYGIYDRPTLSLSRVFAP